MKVGSPIPVKVTLTNTSDHDISDASIPSRESKGGQLRSIDLKVNDNDGKLIPETPYGRRVHGRDQSVFSTVFSYKIQPGKATAEETDLTQEFDLRKPGKYTVQAQRVDPSTKTLVKSDAFTVTLVQ